MLKELVRKPNLVTVSPRDHDHFPPSETIGMAFERTDSKLWFLDYAEVVHCKKIAYGVSRGKFRVIADFPVQQLGCDRIYYYIEDNKVKRIALIAENSDWTRYTNTPVFVLDRDAYYKEKSAAYQYGKDAVDLVAMTGGIRRYSLRNYRPYDPAIIRGWGQVAGRRPQTVHLAVQTVTDALESAALQALLQKSGIGKQNELAVMSHLLENNNYITDDYVIRWKAAKQFWLMAATTVPEITDAAALALLKAVFYITS